MELKEVLDDFKAGKVIGRTSWENCGIQYDFEWDDSKEHLYPVITVVSIPDYAEIDTISGLKTEDLIADDWIVDK